MADDCYCFLCDALSRVSKPAFPVPGKPHPVTGQEEARGEEKRAKTTRSHTTRPIATGHELWYRGWKGNKRNLSLMSRLPTLRYLPTRARRGVPLPRSALGLDLTAGRGYGEDGPTLLFHARPDGHPQDLCLGRIYHLPKVGEAASPHTQTHTHTLTHPTRSHAHTHTMHMLVQSHACTQEFDPIFSFSSVFCGGRLLPWTDVRAWAAPAIS